MIFVCIFCVMSVMAQNMKSVFVAMPDSVTPLFHIHPLRSVYKELHADRETGC